MGDQQHWGESEEEEPGGGEHVGGVEGPGAGGGFRVEPRVAVDERAQHEDEAGAEGVADEHEEEGGGLLRHGVGALDGGLERDGQQRLMVMVMVMMMMMAMMNTMMMMMMMMIG